MPVWSSIKLSELGPSRRIDPEYYQPMFLRYDQVARRTGGQITRYLEQIIQPSEFIRSYAPYGKGKQFWRAQNIRRGFIEQTQPEWIDDAVYSSIPNAHVRPGEVLIVRTGANAGDCAAVPPGTTDVAVSSHTLRLVPIRPQIGFCLSLFFSGAFGRSILERTSSGSSRPQITKESISSLLVPDFAGLEDFCFNAVKKFYELKTTAHFLYTSAQRMLEEELGLDKVDLSHRVGYETRLSEILQARRWDSEFYKPKYQRVMDAVLKAKKVKVESFVPIGRLISYLTNGHTPLHHDLGVGEIPFLTAEHVSDFRLDFGTDKRILRHHHETELARTGLRDGDVLVTIKGRVGNCAVVRDCPDAANINQDVALIRLLDGAHPYFFAAWFNSLIGKQLVEQRSTGGINPFLGLGNLRGMSFPVLEPREHSRIGDLVQGTVENAYAAERQASDLLDQAKRRVEELIEQNTAA